MNSVRISEANALIKLNEVLRIQKQALPKSATHDVLLIALSNSVFGVSRFSEEEKENIRIYQQKVWPW